MWSEDFFKDGLEYVGSPLKTWSIISLVVGIVFIAYGLYQDYKAGKKKQILVCVHKQILIINRRRLFQRFRFLLPDYRQ